jgi:hypothetical protein
VVVTGAGESSCGAEQDTTMIAARKSAARRCHTVRMPNPNSPAAAPPRLMEQPPCRLRLRRQNTMCNFGGEERVHLLICPP